MLRWMVRQLLCNAACVFSVNKFHVDLKAQAALRWAKTLCTLTWATWRIFFCYVAALSSPIPIFDRSGKANLGLALETAVFLELDRRGAEVAYVRTAKGFEFDFHARHVEGREELIQVCARVDQPDTLT